MWVRLVWVRHLVRALVALEPGEVGLVLIATAPRDRAQGLIAAAQLTAVVRGKQPLASGNEHNARHQETAQGA